MDSNQEEGSTGKHDENNDASSHIKSGSLSPDSSAAGRSPMRSPPAQMMDRSQGYDPHRIPEDVFATTSAPTEWSAASNESLFSIHMGNSSFSKEQFYMMYHSGELNLQDDPLYASLGPPLAKEAVDESKQSGPPPAKEAVNESKQSGKNMEKEEGVGGASAQQATAALVMENHDKGMMSPPDEACCSPISGARSSEDARNSDCSTRSFAFPVLAGDTDSSLKVEMKKQPSQSRQQPQPESQPQPQTQPQLQPQPQPQPQPESEPQTNPNPRTEQQSKPEAPKSAPRRAKCCFSWFRCPSCCFSFARIKWLI